MTLHDRLMEWLDQHAPPQVTEVYCWFHNRLSGSRCFAQGCGRLLLWHTPRQWDRCCNTPLAIELTERGWLYGHGIEPDSVVPASHARPA